MASFFALLTLSSKFQVVRKHVAGSYVSNWYTSVMFDALSDGDLATELGALSDGDLVTEPGASSRS